MTAYACIQYVEMQDYEREAIRTALLKYCELDTLAMVMLYEGLKDLAKKGGEAA
jgi:ribonucleotide reductase beta subunit family protein with ferritin-like domain